MLFRESNLHNEITVKLNLQSTVARAASSIDVYKFCKRLTRRSNAAFYNKKVKIVIFLNSLNAKVAIIQTPVH